MSGEPKPILSAHCMFTNLSQVSLCLLSRRLLVFQPIPNRALEVLRKGGAEKPSGSSSAKQLVGGETCTRAPLRVHG